MHQSDHANGRIALRDFIPNSRRDAQPLPHTSVLFRDGQAEQAGFSKCRYRRRGKSTFPVYCRGFMAYHVFGDPRCFRHKGCLFRGQSIQ